MKHSRKLGVELMLETKVVGVTPNEVYLSNGEHIPTRTIVSAVGSKPWPLLDDIPLPRDERGRLVTDEFLRVDGRDDLWAGGDCAAVRHPRGGTCPPVALFALKHGDAIGRNLRRSLAGKSLRPFRSDVIGQGISIGNRTAVGALKAIPLRGEDRVDRVAKRHLGRGHPDLGPPPSAASQTGSSGRSSDATSSRPGRRRSRHSTCATTSTSRARRSPTARGRCGSCT